MGDWIKGGLYGILIFIILSILPIYYQIVRRSFSFLDILIYGISFFIFGSLIYYAEYNKKMPNWLKGGFIGLIVFIFLAFDMHYITSSLASLIELFSNLFDYIFGNYYFYEPFSHASKINLTGVFITAILFFAAGALIGLSIRKRK